MMVQVKSPKVSFHACSHFQPRTFLYIVAVFQLKSLFVSAAAVSDCNVCC